MLVLPAPLLTDDPPPIRYPNLACEVLTADAWPIIEALLNPLNLTKFLAVLDSPMHPLVGRFVSVGSLKSAKMKGGEGS